MELIITHDQTRHRFETIVEAHLAYVEYVPQQGVISIIHTIVPKVIEGRGIAAALVKATLEFAKEQGIKVIPICSYAVVYLKRHPEYQPICSLGAE